MTAGAIILAGGKSRRMGMDKALLQLNQQANIQRIASQLQKCFPALIVVTNHPQDFSFIEAPIVSDYFSGKGPLAGIHAGLTASPYEVNVIAACDMPFLSAELAQRMVNLSDGYDAVVPVINGERHPLFSVFKKKLAAEIAESIAAEQLSMMAFLDRIKVRYLMEKDLRVEAGGRLERIFFNMNTPMEYKIAKKWAEGESSERK